MNNNIYIIKYYVYIYITIERERKRDVMSMLMVVQQQNKQFVIKSRNLYTPNHPPPNQKKLATLAVTYPPDSTNLWQNHRSFMEEFL